MRRCFVIFSHFCILPVIFFIEGCVVFNPVGDAISAGYENTLTYFNVYYNARRLFRDAESEIIAASKNAPASMTVAMQTPQIPADAAKNLDLVIDKCSNILAYHSKSSFVDDALMMTGKAFYYKSEYSKADRKFLELLSQFPNSSMNLEAQLWSARSEEKLGEYDQALKSANTLVAAAEQSREADILAGAYSVLGSLSVHAGAVPTAIEFFQKSAKAADSDQLKADAWYRAGRLYFDDGQFENAVDASSRVDEYSDDVYQIFQSKLLMTRAYRKLRHLNKALALESEMSKDYRFRDYLGSILLERGKILLTGGNDDQAIALFQEIDTTYAKSEIGATADFELGKHFELTARDYERARYFYSRAMAVPSTPVSDSSAHKVSAIGLYLTNIKEVSKDDSILTLLARSENVRLLADSLSPSRKDTGTTVVDSAKAKRTATVNSIGADSLNSLVARSAASLGELFYTDLVNPDSAIYWLRYSLLHKYDATNAPRILYMLSELATSYPDRTTVTSKEFQDQLIRDFPNSYFARQLQNPALGQQIERKEADSASVAYGFADSLIDSGKNEEAIAALKAIVDHYPDAPVAAKCRYAIGWLYENRLSRMDSAAAAYKLLLVLYPTTPYALAVNGKQLDTLAVTSMKTETLSPKLPVQSEKKDSAQVGETNRPDTKSSLVKPPGTLSRRARILQSMHTKPIERE